MFSSRLPLNLAANATSRALDRLRHQGVAIIDLTESNPTRAGFRYPDDLLAPLSDPRALQYDPAPLGVPSARAAVAAEFHRRHLNVSPDHIALTASTSEAYALLIKLLCSPGDAILVPRPSYPLFEHLAALEGIQLHHYPLEYHGAWRIDLGALRANIGGTTRAVLVVSPNNPTGSILHRHDLVAIAELCAANNMALIGDEVFADYLFDASHPVTSVLHQRDAIACSLGGLSKSAGLPQLKLGWIAFGGPSSDLHRLLTAFEVIADTYLSVATPVQMAAASLIARGAEIRAQIHARLRRNLDALRAAAAAFPSISVMPVEGGWSAVLQVPALRTEETLVLDLLTTDFVLVHPGYFFDFEREAYVVISLLVEPVAFDAGVARLLSRASTPGDAS